LKKLLNNKIIRDTALLTLMQLLLDSASLLINAFITRRLGASATGLLSLTGAFLSLAGILSNGSAFLCTSRLISAETGRENGSPERVLLHGIRLCMLLSTAVSAVILLFSGSISRRFFGDAEMASALRMMPAALITGAAGACLKGYFNAVRRAGIAAACDMTEFAVRSLLIVAMTLSAGSPDATDFTRILILSVTAGSFSSLLLLLVLFACQPHGSKGQGTLTFRQYAALAFPIMGGGILTSLLSSTNDALIPFCLRQYGDSADAALSLFGVFEAIVIPTLFFPSVVLCSMSGVIVSESARAAAAGNRERIASLSSRLLSGTLAYAIFAAAVLLRTGSPLGELLGGGETAGRMITVIAPVVPFIYLEIILEALIKGLGQQGFSSLNYLAEYVIRIAAVLILVPVTGFTGIAVSYYASNIFGNTMRLVKVLRCTGISLRPAETILMPALAALSSLACAELLFHAAGTATEELPGLAVLISVWMLFYGGILYLVRILNTGSINKGNLLLKLHKEERQM